MTCLVCLSFVIPSNVIWNILKLMFFPVKFGLFMTTIYGLSLKSVQKLCKNQILINHTRECKSLLGTHRLSETLISHH